MPLELLSRASTAPKMKMKVAATAIQENNMLPVPSTFWSLLLWTISGEAELSRLLET